MRCSMINGSKTANITTGSPTLKKAILTHATLCFRRKNCFSTLLDPGMECELTCKPDRGTFFALLAPSVPAGTACVSNHDGVCVGGDCQVSAFSLSCVTRYASFLVSCTRRSDVTVWLALKFQQIRVAYVEVTDRPAVEYLLHSNEI